MIRTERLAGRSPIVDHLRKAASGETLACRDPNKNAVGEYRHCRLHWL